MGCYMVVEEFRTRTGTVRDLTVYRLKHVDSFVPFYIAFEVLFR